MTELPSWVKPGTKVLNAYGEVRVIRTVDPTKIVFTIGTWASTDRFTQTYTLIRCKVCYDMV